MGAMRIAGNSWNRFYLQVKTNADAVAVQRNPVLVFEANFHSQNFGIKPFGFQGVCDTVIDVLYSGNHSFSDPDLDV